MEKRNMLNLIKKDTCHSFSNFIKKCKMIKVFLMLFLVFGIIFMGRWTLKSAFSMNSISVRSIEDVKNVVNQAAGRHGKYIDRVKLSGYAEHFYQELEKGLSENGCLINPEQDEFLYELYGKQTYGIKVLETEYLPKDEVNEIVDYVSKEGVVEDVFDAFRYDHPEIFWISNRVAVNYVYDEQDQYDQILKKVTIYFSLKEVIEEQYQNPEFLKEKIKERELLVDRIIKEGSIYTSDAEKVIFFHDWITSKNSYNLLVHKDEDAEASSDVYNCISALREKNGKDGPVCAGYAKLLQLLCNRAGIECVFCAGNFKTNEKGYSNGHAWNMVKISDVNLWYVVDSTWDDPWDDSEEKLSGKENHKYLLVGSDTVVDGQEVYKTHKTYSFLKENEPELSVAEYDTSLLKDKNIFNTTIDDRISNSNQKTDSLDTDNKDFTGYRVGEIINGEGIRYKIKIKATQKKSGTAVVMGLTSKKYKLKKIVIGDSLVAYSGRNEKYVYRITDIKSSAFKNNSVVTTIIIPKYMKKIGLKAFYKCKKVKSITIKSKKLKKALIGKKAFARMPSGIKITLPREKKSYYKKILKKCGIRGAKYRFN